MLRIRLSAIFLKVLLVPVCLLPLVAGCGGTADPSSVASSSATDSSGDVAPPSGSAAGGGGAGGGGGPADSSSMEEGYGDPAAGGGSGGGSDEGAYMDGYMNDAQGGGDEYGTGAEGYGMGAEGYGASTDGYDMYGGESMDGGAGMYGQASRPRSSGLLGAVAGQLQQQLSPQLLTAMRAAGGGDGGEKIKTFRELANEAFVGGDEDLALKYLYGHMASEYELAGPAFNDVAYSRMLAKPVWFIRWGASLHVRADATETPHPIVEGMSSPLPERSAMGGRFGRRGRGAAPEMESPEMDAGMASMEMEMASPGRAGAPGSDASNRIDQTLAKSLGLVSDVVGKEFDARFASGAFGKAFQNVEVTPPPAEANRGGRMQIDERTGEAIRDPSAMMGSGAEGYGAAMEGSGDYMDPSGEYADPAAQMRAGMEGYGVGAPPGSGAGYGAEAGPGYGAEAGPGYGAVDAAAMGGAAEYMAPGAPGANRPGAARPAAPATPRFNPALPRWRPGMVFVGEVPLSEALLVAKENGLQFLFHFDVIVQGGKKTRTIVRVINVADGKTIVASKRLDNVECYKLVEAKQTSEPKYVEEAVLPMFDVIDEKLQVAELPEVSADQAKARIAKLLETAPAFDLASMAEVRLFQSRDLLTEPEVATAMHLFGGDDALILVYGGPAERRTIIRQQIEP